MTSCGEYLTTNKYQNFDLFWALRGGGGGSCGVVTSVTYRTFESLPVAYYYLQANATGATAMKKHITGLFQFQSNLTDDGWGGYGKMDESNMLFALSLQTEAANISTQSLTDYASSFQSQGVSSVVQITAVPSWYKWYKLLFDAPGQSGENAMMTSRFLP